MMPSHCRTHAFLSFSEQETPGEEMCFVVTAGTRVGWASNVNFPSEFTFSSTKGSGLGGLLPFSKHLLRN